VTDEYSTLFIVKDEDGTIGGLDRLDEAVLFRGKTNPLVYRRIYDLELMCTFNLQLFPFDHQEGIE